MSAAILAGLGRKGADPSPSAADFDKLFAAVDDTGDDLAETLRQSVARTAPHASVGPVSDAVVLASDEPAAATEWTATHDIGPARTLESLLDDAYRAIAAEAKAGARYLKAVDRAQVLDDARSMAREYAVRRIAKEQKLHTTNAEKVVGLDDEFKAFCERQRKATARRIRRQVQLSTAQKHATIAVALVTAFANHKPLSTQGA